MLKAIALWLLIVFFVTSAQSQGPSPSAREVSSKHQQKPATQQQPSADDKRGTKEAPIIVEMTNPPNGDTIAAEIKKNREDQTAENRRALIFNILLVLVGVLQGGAIIYTALVTNKAANAARDSAKALIASERAYVFVNSFQPIMLRNINNQVTGWQCIVIWENSGTTPTKDLCTYVSWQKRPSPLPTDFDFPDLGMDTSEPSQGFLGPKSQSKTPICIITVADAKSLMNQQIFMYIWGWAAYRDIFPGTPIHKTEFCTQVIGVAVPDNPHVAMLQFRNYRTHNTGT